MAKRQRTAHDVLVEALGVASYSASKLAADADLDWSTVAKWKAGSRTPQPHNLAAVARALMDRGARMAELGRELADLAKAGARAAETRKR